MDFIFVIKATVKCSEDDYENFVAKHFPDDGTEEPEFDISTVMPTNLVCDKDYGLTSENGYEDGVGEFWFNANTVPEDLFSNLAQMYQDYEFTFEYCEDDIGNIANRVGTMFYKHGRLQYTTKYTPRSETAFEVAMDMCGHEGCYKYHKRSHRYTYSQNYCYPEDADD